MITSSITCSLLTDDHLFVCSMRVLYQTIVNTPVSTSKTSAIIGQRIDKHLGGHSQSATARYRSFIRKGIINQPVQTNSCYNLNAITKTNTYKSDSLLLWLFFVSIYLSSQMRFLYANRML